MKVSLRPARRTTALLALASVLAGVACKRSRAPAEEQPDVSERSGEVVSAQASARPASPRVLGGLPVGLGNPLPLNAVVVTKRTLGQSTITLAKTITRGKARVHVVDVPGGGKKPESEWLIVQSSNDPRRASGLLIEHGIRAIVEYRPHELATAGMSPKWAEAATLGLPTTEAFETLEPTGKRQQAFGLEFMELALPAGNAGRFRELWWSEQAAVPLRWVTEDSRGRTEVTATFSTNIDAEVLRDPRERFPEYEVTNLEKLQSKPRVEPEPGL